jgi:hypothetical protein
MIVESDSSRSGSPPGPPGAGAPALRPFSFARDTFAYANELIWQYRFDPRTGATTTFRTEPPPSYAHHCFVMVRSARQFFYHARFQADWPKADAAACRRLVRDIVSRSPRWPSPEAEKVAIPGYDCLRSFSQGQEAALKLACGGAWESYVMRSHWRMIFPITRRHQAQMARQLVESFARRVAPIVHLVRFPQLTINHGIVLLDRRATESAIHFTAYDPNIPAHPVELTYHRAERTFSFPRNHYWSGGRLNVIEVFRNWLY